MLRLAEGFPWATIATLLFRSSWVIARRKERFTQGGVEPLLGEDGVWQSLFKVGLIQWAAYRVLAHTHRDFDFPQTGGCSAASRLRWNRQRQMCNAIRPGPRTGGRERSTCDGLPGNCCQTVEGLMELDF